MHVAHLYDGPEPVHEGRGSVPDVVWNVARETAAAGHRVTVVERRWADLPATASHEGVTFERLALATGDDEPRGEIPQAAGRSPVRLARRAADRANVARAARQRLAELDPDVLHVHRPVAASVLLTVARGYRPRTVYTAHIGAERLNRTAADGGVTPAQVRSRLSPAVHLAKRAAMTTVLNADMEAAFRKRGVPPDRLAVIPNGVDLERFDAVDPAEAARIREAYWETDAPALLFVGTLRPAKGVDDLVRAVGMLREGYGREVELVIAGADAPDDAYTSEVRAIVRERDLGDQVTLAGFVPDDELAALYAAADVFVSPAREAGFGTTVAEAMAAGTPVVATRVGGVGQLLDAGACGRLLVPDHPTGLAATLDDLLDDAAQRERLAAAAREHVRTFAWSAVAERYLQVYTVVGG